MSADDQLKALLAAVARPPDSPAAKAEIDQAWADLYRLVHWVLGRCKAPILESLPDTRENYIQDYIAFKLIPAIAGGKPLPWHCGALVAFFKRFLTDCERRSQGHAEPISEGLTTPAVEDCETLLRKHFGLAMSDLETCAQAFVDELRREVPPHDWLLVRQVYAATGEDALTVNAFRAQYPEVPNVYARVKSLGLPLNKTAQGVAYFRDTRIGRWISSSMCPTSGGDAPEALAAADGDERTCIQMSLEMLAAVALRWSEP